jgi:fructan beta-fructosidase
LSWQSWNVREWRGQRARIEIVDSATGGWGHINVDHIFFANEPARPAQAPALWADFGPDFYAAVSWSDTRKRSSGRPWLGWMSNWQYANDVPTSPWRSAMSLPRDLSLRRSVEGLRLVQKPVPELAKLKGRTIRLGKSDLSKANDWLAKHGVRGGMWDIEVEFDSASVAGEVGLKLFGGAGQETKLTMDLEKSVIVLDRTRSGQTGFHPRFSGTYVAPFPKRGPSMTVRLIMDVSSVEIFANRGESVLTALVLPGECTAPLEFWASDPGFTLKRLTVSKLTSSMQKKGGKKYRF